MKLCGKCNGSGWYGGRTNFSHNPGGPCRACDGSGYDKRWGEKGCKSCSNTIEYRYDWSNVPDYCEDCRRDQYKTCANSHCNGTVRYKKFWDNIPDYCQSCKGWYEKECENTHCRGTIRVHASWTNIPKYCKGCKGWYQVSCSNIKCSSVIQNHTEWNKPKTLCDMCFKMSRRKDEQLCGGNDLEEFISKSKGIRVTRSHYGEDYRHVIVYVDGGHVSGDVHIYSTECLNFHYTLEIYDQDGKRRGKTTW